MENYDEPVKILCVDDERNVLRALERIFLDDDYEIVLANSGEEGLAELADSGPFQVVVSDYRMPVMNGVQFLTKVYEKWPDTVRIVLSGYADAGAIVEAINEGHIYKFIPKPWNDDELRVTIQNCLERYFLQKKNRELVAELEIANSELEVKIAQRTEQLEIRNRVLEFSQALVDALPVAVVGIDENGMIAICNKIGRDIMNSFCSCNLGGDIQNSCSSELLKLVETIQQQGKYQTDLEINGSKWRVLGELSNINESRATVIVFVEVS